MVLRSSDWELRLFGAVAESVEHTAIQRGVERWEPRGFRTVVSGWAAEDKSAPEPQTTSPNTLGPVLLGDPPVDERFILWVPFYELAGAAGAFGPEQAAPDPDAASAWARVEGLRVSKDMFALRVVGHSMEPRFPTARSVSFAEAMRSQEHGRGGSSWLPYGTPWTRKPPDA
jgi:hypothetical protein